MSSVSVDIKVLLKLEIKTALARYAILVCFSNSFTILLGVEVNFLY